MKRNKGKLINSDKRIIGYFTTKNNIFKRNRIVKCSKIPFFMFGVKAFIVPYEIDKKISIPIFQTNEEISYEENDIIAINTDGYCVSLWENNSKHNAFYVTDICNSKCIMCPQIADGESKYKDCLELLGYINLNKIKNIGITGGEPTLEINKLVELLEKIAKKSPNKKVHILTNGRQFSNIENVRKLSNIKNIQLSFGIPLYSNIAEDHNYIVGAEKAFEQTINGLYNLAKYRQKIEIRIVILKQNYKILTNLSEFIYRNIPFITNVALMGLEYHGNAETNYNEIAIDPKEYEQELYETVKSFIRYNIIVDVYNIPFCLADERIHEFCRDSISTWKKGFLDICYSCSKKEKCSGIFETSFIHSKNINPYKEKE